MSVKYYDENAEKFYENTVALSMGEPLEKFLKYLEEKFPVDMKKNSERDFENGREKLKILDLGCGSGRDARYFLEQGYEITALDLSPLLAEKASKFIGQEVIVKDMRELDYEDEFHGIWACASLLHISYIELEDVFIRCFHALKKGGIFYASFKYGDVDYIKDGREFTCFTEKRMENFLHKLSQREDSFKRIEIFVTGDIRDDRHDERWLNIIIQKLFIPKTY